MPEFPERLHQLQDDILNIITSQIIGSDPELDIQALHQAILARVTEFSNCPDLNKYTSYSD